MQALHRWLWSLITFGLATSAAGQDLGGYYGGMAMNGMVTNQINITQKGIGRNTTHEILKSGQSNGTSSFTDTAGAPVAEIDTHYQPSLPARRSNLAGFVANSRRSDPQGAAAMERLFASGDIIAALGQQIKRYGLSVDDVADAYALYWVSAWQAANGDTSTPGRATFAAVRRQAANGLSATPDFVSASNANKQQLAEALLVQSMLVGAMQDKYADDADMKAKVGDAARKGADGMGLDLDAMTLTKNGFVSTKRLGANDSSSRNANRGAEASTAPPYALLAAAGGAGLGAVYLLGKAAGRRG